MVTGDTKRVMTRLRWSRMSAPRQCLTPSTSSMTRSFARWCSKNVMLGSLVASFIKARSISSPTQCTQTHCYCFDTIISAAGSRLSQSSYLIDSNSEWEQGSYKLSLFTVFRQSTIFDLTGSVQVATCSILGVDHPSRAVAPLSRQMQGTITAASEVCA